MIPAVEIRKQFYELYGWHGEVKLADAGHLRSGSSLSDTYAALAYVVQELIRAKKRVFLFGGSHDVTLGIYQAFVKERRLIEATAIDALVDINHESSFPDQRFLLDVLTSEPNYIRHFSLLGFQSYFVKPRLLEIIDKLRFDCVRVGKMQERLEESEPIIRSSQMLSFDVNAIANAYAPSNLQSPNGFTGQEACSLLQYAGMSPVNQVVNISGFSGHDPNGLTAKQIAQMIWYCIDGMQKALHEEPLSERSGYNEYHLFCAEVEAIFLQSRNTGRWWMQLPDQQFIPCTYTDYLMAGNNELPERWLRAQERM
jgi:arginase family enzyme